MSGSSRVADWVLRAESHLQQLKRIDLGYAQGDNSVGPPAEQEQLSSLVLEGKLDESSALVVFLRAHDGFTFSDVHSGYFLHRVSQIRNGLKTGEPRHVRSPEGDISILVFGSDGGGGRFALRLDDGQVLYLPLGAVHDGVFDGVNTRVTPVASDFSSFLERVLADLRAFVNDESGWDYMAQ